MKMTMMMLMTTRIDEGENEDDDEDDDAEDEQDDDDEEDESTNVMSHAILEGLTDVIKMTMMTGWSTNAFLIIISICRRCCRGGFRHRRVRPRHDRRRRNCRHRCRRCGRCHRRLRRRSRPCARGRREGQNRPFTAL